MSLCIEYVWLYLIKYTPIKSVLACSPPFSVSTNSDSWSIMACRAVFAHFSRREMMSSGWDKPQSLKVSSRFCSLLGSALGWVSPLSTQHSILERGRQYNEERRGRIIFHFQSYFPPDSTAPTTLCSKSISSPGVCLYDQKWYPSTLCYWVLNSTRRNVHVCTVYVYCSSTVSIICCQKQRLLLDIVVS